MKYKNLIFDVDGTLWDSTDLVAISWQEAVDQLGYSKAKLSGPRLKQEFGKPMDVIARNLFADLNDPWKMQELLDLCCRKEEAFLRTCKKDVTYPGMKDCLTALSKDYKLFIVSNCQSGYIEVFMEACQVEDLICDIDCFGNTGVSKDRTIGILMERNKLDPKECVYIGDTRGDQLAAKGAGIDFIHASYGFDPDLVAEQKIKELKDLLEM